MLLKLKWISFWAVENNEKAISSVFFLISKYKMEDEAACCFDIVRHVWDALGVLTLPQQGLQATKEKVPSLSSALSAESAKKTSTSLGRFPFPAKQSLFPA